MATNRMWIQRRAKAFVLLALATILAIAPWSMGKAVAETSKKPADDVKLEIPSLKKLRGKKLGMLSGAQFDTMLLNNLKGINQEDFLYFNSNAETVGALLAGKVDAMVTDLPIGQLAVNVNEGIGLIPEFVVEDHYAYVLPKGSALTAKINERLLAYRKDGTVEKIYDKWAGSDEQAKTMPDQDWDAPNGTLMVAMSPDNEPINYVDNDRACGMCIELLELIARDLGYGVEYRSTNTGSLIAEVESGKADLAAYSFSITEERKRMVDMTEPYYDGGIAVVVRTAEGNQVNKGFFEAVSDSFERTFIVEDRWKLILAGLGVTLLISVASGVAGLALGFAFVLLRRKKEGGLADRLIRLLENLVGGLPVVVVLMLFYYVVFGALNISEVIIAILAFTVLFGASTGSIMWNAIRGMDPGQAEAGRALGFSDVDTFFLVVLPQAARQFVPTLITQFVSLVKDTAVVGYIAVQDLTRVGDLIRSRTMEAFFPIIAIAIIYFVFCRLMAWLLGLLAKGLEPRDEPRTIKGVELQ